MADDPKGDRNVVRFEPNERVDLPDIKALQDNARSETRLLLHNFVFGHGVMGLMQADGLGWRNIRDRATEPANPLLVAGRPEYQTNFGKNGLCNYIGVEPSAGPNVITVNVAYLEDYQGATLGPLGGGPLTGGFGGTTLDNGDSELGTAVGCEGDDTQTISMPVPDGNYGVYIETVFDPAIPGTRLFWNNASTSEDAVGMDTRKVAGWNASIHALLGGPPRDGQQLIAVYNMTGGVWSDFHVWQNNIFEGVFGSLGAIGAGTAQIVGATAWGFDGSSGSSLYGQRSYNRAVNGVSCWQDWAAVLRAQLRDIIGDGEGNGIYNWYTMCPEFTGVGGGSSGGGTIPVWNWTGERASISHLKTHVEHYVDPHGSAQRQTDLIVGSGTQEAQGNFAVGLPGSPSYTGYFNTGGGAAFPSLMFNDQTQVGSGEIGAGKPGEGTVFTNGMTVGTGQAAWANLILPSNAGFPGTTSTQLLRYAPSVENIRDDTCLYYVHLGPSAFLPTNGNVGGLAANSRPYQLIDLPAEYATGVGPGTPNRGGTAWQWNSPDLTHQSFLECDLNRYLGYGAHLQATNSGNGGVRIQKIRFLFYRNPNFAATNAYAAYARLVYRDPRQAINGQWSQYFSGHWGDNATGTDDLVREPGDGLSPQSEEWDFTADAIEDPVIGGNGTFQPITSTFEPMQWCLNIKLEGDGASDGSPYLVGVVLTVAVGSIL